VRTVPRSSVRLDELLDITTSPVSGGDQHDEGSQVRTGTALKAVCVNRQAVATSATAEKQERVRWQIPAVLGRDVMIGSGHTDSSGCPVRRSDGA
jgi:hypothetical protein